MIALLLALAAAAAIEIPPATALELVALPAVEERTLPGGARAWTVDRPGPLAEIELLWTADAVDGRGILAQRLLAALIEEEVDEAALDRLGAVLDAGRTAAGLRLRLQVPAEGLPAALALLSPVLRDPALPRAGVRRLRRAWREQERRAAQSPGRVAERAELRATLPPDHPLASLPTLDDGRWLGRREVAAAHRLLIEQGGATAILVGGDPAALAAPLAFLRAPPPVEVVPPALPGPRVVLVDLPGVGQARVVASFPFPEDALLPPFGRYDLALRGLVYGAEVDVQRWPGGARLRIATRLDPERLADGLAALRESLGAPWTDGERARAAAAALFAAARTLDALPALGAELGERAARGEDAGAFQRALDAIAGANLPALDPGAATWVILGEREEIEPILEAAGLVPTDLWSARRAAGAR